MPAHTLMFVELSDCDLIKNSTEHAPRMSLLRLTIRIYAYQGVTKRCRPSWLTNQKSELKNKKQDRTIKESELKTNRHNRPIQKSELTTNKQDRTIKESELKTNRHNRPIQKSELDINRLYHPIQSEDRIGIGRSINRTFRPPLGTPNFIQDRTALACFLSSIHGLNLGNFTH